MATQLIDVDSSPSIDELYLLYNGTVDSGGSNGGRILHYLSPAGHSNFTNNLVKMWFKLSGSTVLSNFRMYNQHAIDDFTLSTASSNTDQSGTVIIDVTGGAGTANSWSNYYSTTNNSPSQYYFLNITKWTSVQYFQITEVELVGNGPFEVGDEVSPTITINGNNPVVIALWNTYTDQGAYANDDIDGNITNSIQTSSNVNTSIIGTYQVTYSVSDNAGNTTSATRTINVENIEAHTVAFNSSIAYIRRDDLATLINSFTEVSSLKEIYNMWYNNTQITGGTDCWIYYAYSTVYNQVLYTSRKIQFLSKNDGTYEWIDNETIVNATVTSNGLSAADLTDYTSFYSGLQPFNIDMSSTSINIVNTLLNNSGYSLYNYLQIFNIWYNETNAFDMDYDNTTREIDVWVYVLTDETAMEEILDKHGTPIEPITDFDENQITIEMLKPYLLEGGNVQPIFETRKMKYTVKNNNASYTWTLYTNETIESTINDTGYSIISSIDNYKLSYFYFDSYTIVRKSSKEALRSLYLAYYNSTKKLKKINEVWYNTLDINSGDANDNSSLSVAETTITTSDIGMKIYGTGKDLDEYGLSIVDSKINNKLDVKYNKNTRNWNTLMNIEPLLTVGSGLEDGLSSNDYFQIYHNIDYNIVQKIPELKDKYNETYGEEISIDKLYESDTINTAHILDCYMKFYLLSNPISVLYTSLEYDRVINSWKIKNPTEVYNSVKASNRVKYSEFRLTHLNGKEDDLKEQYNIVYPLHSIIQIYKLWYNSSSAGDEIVDGIMFYSYKENNDVLVKTQFATVNILYTVITDTFSVMSETPTIRSYDYNGVQAGGLMEVETYTGEVYFTVDITNGMPIMISNTHIKSNFDVAYRAENSGRSVVGIHRIWIEKGTGSSGLIYASPVVDLWVFYSHKADNSEEISYESRKMNYDLQLNELTYTSELVSGTVRSTGLTVSDEVNLIQIYSIMPQVPLFSTYQARKLSSTVQLKEVCVDLNISVIPTESIDNIIILELWYDMRTVSFEYVDCIAYIQITRDDTESIEYKTFYITYNNDTKLFVIGIYNVTNDIVMVNSTADDNKLNEVLSGLEKQIDIYDSAGNLTHDDYHKLFYTKPTGTSIHGEGIKFIDNSIQSTAMPPVGTVLMYACEETPTGWLDCDGSLLSRYDAELIDLFNIIGYTYGGSNGSSFNLPNLHERFPMGSDSTLANNDPYWDNEKKQGGNDILQPKQFIHDHTVNYNASGPIANVGTFDRKVPGNGQFRYANVTKKSGNTTSGYNSNTTATYLPLFTRLRFIIKK